MVRRPHQTCPTNAAMHCTAPSTSEALLHRCNLLHSSMPKHFGALSVRQAPSNTRPSFVPQQLDIKTKDQVLEYGIANYNKACRGIVQRFAKEWETVVSRTGRWIDFEVLCACATIRTLCTPKRTPNNGHTRVWGDLPGDRGGLIQGRLVCQERKDRSCIPVGQASRRVPLQFWRVKNDAIRGF